MWLLNSSNYRLEPNNLDGPERKPYWILSHTWGDDEVTYQDMQDLVLASQKKGFRKIEAMCKLALSNGYHHVWIDTCCIDKTSSAELSESINSMFYWYKMAARCIAFLEDLEPGSDLATEKDLHNCRWFTRGWTLQELIAPFDVWFYDAHWHPRGTRGQLCRALSAITNIGEGLLASRDAYGIGDDLQSVPVATRMSWAAGRQTTCIEDKAYCLLGIFDVHMPLLYGERDQAFLRLQHTIAQKVNDMSLFAWIAAPNDDYPQSFFQYSGLLARDPSQFAAFGQVSHIWDPLLPSPSWITTNAGLEMTTALDLDDSDHTVITRAADGSIKTELGDSWEPFCYRLFLHCQVHSTLFPPGAEETLAIRLRKTSSGFVRFKPTELCSVKRSAMQFADPGPIRISTSLTVQQDLSLLLPSFDTSVEGGSAANALCIHWNIVSRDTRVALTYHPSHLWDRGQLYCTYPPFDIAVPCNLSIGLVEISISNRAGSEPFSRTCWVLCGMVLEERARDPRPWMQLACEEADGSVNLFRRPGRNCRHSRELRNPYALSSLLGQVQGEGYRPDPDVPPGSCDVSCTESLHLRISASNFKFLNAAEAYQVTIRVEQLHPPTPPDGLPPLMRYLRLPASLGGRD